MSCEKGTAAEREQGLKCKPPVRRADFYRVILGLYWENGKENGNYYNGLYRGYIGLYWRSDFS